MKETKNLKLCLSRTRNGHIYFEIKVNKPFQQFSEGLKTRKFTDLIKAESARFILSRSSLSLLSHQDLPLDRLPGLGGDFGQAVKSRSLVLSPHFSMQPEKRL